MLDFISKIVKPEIDALNPLESRIDEKGNLLSRFGTGRKGKRILYLSYGMNPTPGSMQDPYSGKIVDGSRYGADGECVWGRGASEQKGGLAAMLESLRIITQSKYEIPGEIIFVTSTAGETGRHDSIMHIIEKEKIAADWAVITGPPKIQIGNKGRIDVMINVQGRASHSSRPWEGINAIDGAVMVLGRLGSLMPNPSDKSHPELGKVTLTPTRIESFPRATHTVQEKCTIVLDRRLLPGDDPNEAFDQIVEAVGNSEVYGISVEKGAFMYPSEIDKNDPLVIAFKNAIHKMFTKEAELTYAHQTIDSGYLTKVGIPTINYGSYDFRFTHTDHDIVEITKVAEAAMVYAYAAMRGSIDEK